VSVLIQTTILLLAALSPNSYAEFNAQRTSPVAVGEVAPDFTLEDQRGHKVTLSDSRDKNPVVVVFYRGYW
jgi:cytochrome oxidase Cu insertion factor (SCO1/SenC/PrrC family)